MKLISCNLTRIVFVGIFLLAAPAMAQAPPQDQTQVEPEKASPPPVQQKLVREGDLAIKLELALGLGTSGDEIEAETLLGNVGILPRNGWIADYPVTPDIVGELYKSVRDAAAGGKISTSIEESLKRLDAVINEAGLGVYPYTVGSSGENKPMGAEDYPNPAVINNYYDDQGPPVVTYYAPPPDYYYLYSWVAFPFWYGDFWFPGYYIMHDFQRTVGVGNRVRIISNHFNDIRSHRVYRIDPVSRYRGRTFAGIGVNRTRGFITTGIPRSGRTIFNAPRTWGAPVGRMAVPGYGPRGEGRMMAPVPGGGGAYRGREMKRER